MFANYLSRKNFSHTRANHYQNASPVSLPAAPISITSQGAASCGLLCSSCRKACFFQDGDSEGSRHSLLAAWGEGALVAWQVFIYPQFSPLSLSLFSLPQLFPHSPTESELENFFPHGSPALILGSSASFLSPFSLCPSSSSSQT